MTTIPNESVLTITHIEMVQSRRVTSVDQDILRVVFEDFPRHMDLWCSLDKIDGELSRPTFLSEFKKTNCLSSTSHPTCRDSATVSRSDYDNIIFDTHHGDWLGDALIFLRDCVTD
jgi:hypothetical protein